MSSERPELNDNLPIRPSCSVLNELSRLLHWPFSKTRNLLHLSGRPGERNNLEDPVVRTGKYVACRAMSRRFNHYGRKAESCIWNPLLKRPA